MKQTEEGLTVIPVGKSLMLTFSSSTLSNVPQDPASSSSIALVFSKPNILTVKASTLFFKGFRVFLQKQTNKRNSFFVEMTVR